MKKIIVNTLLSSGFLLIIGLSNPSISNAEDIENIEVVSQSIEISEEVLPEMPLSEAINSGFSQVILSDIDIPEIAKILDGLDDKQIVNRFKRTASKGYWKYKYTAEPFAFYQHTKTKKWKLVQVTSTTNHLVNTMIGGYVKAPWGISYNKPNNRY